MSRVSFSGVDVGALRWFAGRMRTSRGAIVLISALSATQAALAVATLLLVRRVVDDALLHRNQPLLWQLGGAVLVIRLVASALTLNVRRRVLTVVKRIIAQLRNDLSEHLLSRNRRYFTQADFGLLQTRLVQDTERMDSAATTLIASVIPALTGAALLLPIVLSISPRLVLMAALALPMLWIVSRYMGARVATRLTRFRESFDQVSRNTQSMLRIVELIRLRAWQQPALEQQTIAHDALRHDGIEMGMGFAWQAHAQRTVLSILGVALLVLGSSAVIAGSLTLGQFLVFYLAAGMLNGYADALVSSLADLSSGSAACRAVMSVLGEGHEEPYSGADSLQITGAVSLESVRYAYDETPLLADISLDVAEGEHVALVGDNGAGKSTIAQLLLGTERPSHGVVRFDGRALESLEIKSLRRQIGFVPQQPFFFRGTIRENLQFGHVRIDPSCYEDALRISAAKSVLERLPDALDTVIGDGGTRLSGGELQRLSIARALMHRPRLLILDEPTTHLDATSISHLLTALAEWDRRPTIFLISHDPDVLHFVDHAWRLTHGRLESLNSPALIA